MMQREDTSSIYNTFILFFPGSDEIVSESAVLVLIEQWLTGTHPASHGKHYSNRALVKAINNYYVYSLKHDTVPDPALFFGNPPLFKSFLRSNDDG